MNKPCTLNINGIEMTFLQSEIDFYDFTKGHIDYKEINRDSRFALNNASDNIRPLLKHNLKKYQESLNPKTANPVMTVLKPNVNVVINIPKVEATKPTITINETVVQPKTDSVLAIKPKQESSNKKITVAPETKNAIIVLPGVEEQNTLDKIKVSDIVISAESTTQQQKDLATAVKKDAILGQYISTTKWVTAQLDDLKKYILSKLVQKHPFIDEAQIMKVGANFDALINQKDVDFIVKDLVANPHRAAEFYDKSNPILIKLEKVANDFSDSLGENKGEVKIMTMNDVNVTKPQERTKTNYTPLELFKTILKPNADNEVKPTSNRSIHVAFESLPNGVPDARMTQLNAELEFILSDADTLKHIYSRQCNPVFGFIHIDDNKFGIQTYDTPSITIKAITSDDRKSITWEYS